MIDSILSKRYGSLRSEHGQFTENIRVTVERAREFVDEGPHGFFRPQFDYRLSVGVNRLTVLVLVRRGDKYRNTIFKRLL